MVNMAQMSQGRNRCSEEELFSEVTGKRWNEYISETKRFLLMLTAQ